MRGFQAQGRMVGALVMKETMHPPGQGVQGVMVVVNQGRLHGLMGKVSHLIYVVFVRCRV